MIVEREIDLIDTMKEGKESLLLLPLAFVGSGFVAMGVLMLGARRRVH